MDPYSAMYNFNGTTFRDVYATGRGATTGQIATGVTSGRGTAPTPSAEVQMEADAAALPGGVSPLIGGLIFVALVFGLMFLAKRLGTDDDFKSLKPSIYNVVTVSLAAAAGLPLLKYGAIKLKIPGVSAWILAA
jgi:hypothetical protein